MAFIYDLTDTWNAGGTTFNGIKMNVTDSASAAASKLITLQVGGAERFGVRKDGQGYFAGDVGIGTTSPGAKLHVVGNTYVQSGTLFTDAVTSYGGTSLALNGGNTLIALTSGSERMRIDSSGNVGIGTSSPAEALEISRDANPKIRFLDVGNLDAKIGIVGSTALGFEVNGSERARIDSSGNLLVGTTSTSGLSSGSSSNPGFGSFGGQLRTQWNSDANAYWSKASGRSNVTFHDFYDAGVQVGTITTNGTNAAYNTTSDARLKHDIIDAPEASALIDAIKVRSFKWNADDSEQRYGFVAQELVEVAPEAVHQPEDEDQMMGVDYSKLVPMLVKELQSVRARLAALEGAA